jgi:hypothetical protein
LPLDPIYNFQDRADLGGGRPEYLFELTLVMVYDKLPDRQFADPAVHDFSAGKSPLSAPAVSEPQSMPELAAVAIFIVVKIDCHCFFRNDAAHLTICRF